MPMPSTGPVSFQDFKTEFGIGAGPLGMSQMYRGGAYVKRQTLEYVNETEYGPWSAYQYQPFAGVAKYLCQEFISNGNKSNFIWNDVSVGSTSYFSGALVTNGGFQYQQGDTQDGTQPDRTASIRNRTVTTVTVPVYTNVNTSCLLYTSDAADE